MTTRPTSPYPYPLAIGRAFAMAAATGALACGSADGAADAGNPWPGSAAFAADQVLELRFSLSEADRLSIEENGNQEIYVPARVSISGSALGEMSFAEVGLRHKGNYTLHHCWDDNGGVRNHDGECTKLSYKVKLDAYDPEARLDGLKRLNLHAASADGSKLRELIAYDAFRNFGIEAPRARPARVYVNDEPQGVFIAVEEVDGRFAKSRHPDAGDGNLYKEIWPNASIGATGFIEALRTNDEQPDVSDMLAFAEAVQGATEASFATDLAPFVDLGELVRYVVVDRALKNWDGIMAFYAPQTPHNFYWYRDAGGDERFHLVPWDMDNTLWEFDPFMDPRDWVTSDPVPNWNEAPASCTPRSIWDQTGAVTTVPPRCDRLMNLLALTRWPEFVEQSTTLLDTALELGALQQKLGTWRAELEPIVAGDPFLDLGAWRGEADALERLLPGAISDFRSFVSEGLIAEPSRPPIGSPPEALDDPSASGGLLVAGVTNFEYAPGTESDTVDGLQLLTDERSSLSASWSEGEPLSGQADLRFDFTFVQGPEAWDEWVTASLPTPGWQTVDVRGYQEVVMTVSSDSERMLRVRLEGEAYWSELGGVWSEFGTDVVVSPEPAEMAFELRRMSYPSWAKDAWEAGAGWTTTDADALDRVLATFNGLSFGPRPHTTPEGELPEATESGFLRIDNIYFR